MYYLRHYVYAQRSLSDAANLPECHGTPANQSTTCLLCLTEVQVSDHSLQVCEKILSEQLFMGRSEIIG